MDLVEQQGRRLGTGRDGRGEHGSESKPHKALTIGAVCKILGQEFDDISISKIRYLEDQRLLSPRRTPGGYRLYSQADVERLRAILRMQRDEFLPLRVIRQELASGVVERQQLEKAHGPHNQRQPDRESVTREELMAEAGIDSALMHELEEYKIIRPSSGNTRYPSAEIDLARAAGALARFGVGARNLRILLSSADREAGLLEQVLGAGLRSTSSERRLQAATELDNLVGVIGQLRHLLLLRELRRISDG